MSGHMNSFALLVDDEGGDVSTLIERATAAAAAAAAVKVESQATTNGKQSREMKIGKASRPLPSSDRARSEKGNRGRNFGSRRSSDTDIKQFHNGGSDDFQNTEGVGETEWESVGGNRYQRSIGGSSFQNSFDSNPQGRGRGRGRGRRGNWVGRGRGYARGNENDNKGFVVNNMLENNQLDEGGVNDGWVNGYKPRSGSHSQRDGDNNHGFSEPRFYGGGRNVYRASEGAYFGRNDGRNGDQVSSLNGDAEVAVPASTEVEKSMDLDHAEQGVTVNPENPEVKIEDENSESKIVKEGDSGKMKREDSLRIKEEAEKKQMEEEAERKKSQNEAEAKEMTLDEYEKLCLEKRKGLDSLKAQERRVILDKDFESMQLVEKKKEDGYSTKLKLEKDKLKNKENLEKEEKARKALSINEFLKPEEGKSYGRSGNWRGGQVEKGRFNKGSGGSRRGGSAASAAPNFALPIQDHSQFPGLPASAKA